MALLTRCRLLLLDDYSAAAVPSATACAPYGRGHCELREVARSRRSTQHSATASGVTSGCVVGGLSYRGRSRQSWPRQRLLRQPARAPLGCANSRTACRATWHGTCRATQAGVLERSVALGAVYRATPFHALFFSLPRRLRICFGRESVQPPFPSHPRFSFL
ncbi:hypothetical protein C8J57DRAFT_1357513, partial [Mycena rebaudengoi]